MTHGIHSQTISGHQYFGLAREAAAGRYPAATDRVLSFCSIDSKLDFEVRRTQAGRSERPNELLYNSIPLLT